MEIVFIGAGVILFLLCLWYLLTFFLGRIIRRKAYRVFINRVNATCKIKGISDPFRREAVACNIVEEMLSEDWVARGGKNHLLILQNVLFLALAEKVIGNSHYVNRKADQIDLLLEEYS